ICPWIAEGKLPNLAALMKTGAWGRLASILPPITPPAWTAFMTGKNPGKHGIFDFLGARPGTYELTYLNGASRRAKTIWRMLSDAGYTVGTMNIPFTYPPEHLNVHRHGATSFLALYGSHPSFAQSRCRRTLWRRGSARLSAARWRSRSDAAKNVE